MAQSSDADLLIGHYTDRKVTEIVERTFEQFRKIIDEWKTVSADELLAIGYNLIEATCIQPLLKMSDKPDELRGVLAETMATLIKNGGREVN